LFQSSIDDLALMGASAFDTGPAVLVEGSCGSAISLPSKALRPTSSSISMDLLSMLTSRPSTKT
jgi:hypothetical protein